MPILTSYLCGNLISFLIYCLYLEVNPQIGGIFIRPNSKGERTFNANGIIPMLKYPFENGTFWNPENWDLNWITFTQIGAGVYTLMKNFDQIAGFFM
jgi:hypothetical protein